MIFQIVHLIIRMGHSKSQARLNIFCPSKIVLYSFATSMLETVCVDDNFEMWMNLFFTLKKCVTNIKMFVKKEVLRLLTFDLNAREGHSHVGDLELVTILE